uniref:WD_REPEATS_REGION domain-containing protein n=1 Tax=Mesocestoides corti TaxID=53468 RepID=A0A5K3EIB4_MESCO
MCCLAPYTWEDDTVEFSSFLSHSRGLTLMVGDSGGSVYVYAMKNFPSVGTSAEEATKLTSVLASCLSSQLPT